MNYEELRELKRKLLQDKYQWPDLEQGSAGTQMFVATNETPNCLGNCTLNALRLASVLAKTRLKKVANMVSWAKRELELAGLFDKDSDYGGALGPEILKMVEVFAGQGHSGFSAGMATEILNKLLRYEPLTPVRDPMKEGYNDVSEQSGTKKLYQCTRDSTIFSEDGGKSWYKLVDEPHKDSNGVSYSSCRRVPLDEYNKAERRKEASVSNPRKAFEQALVTQKLAMEFPTEEALKKYLKEHPDADKSKHTVKKEEEKKEEREEDEPSKDKEEEKKKADEIKIRPAGYAKNMMLVQIPGEGGWKSRGQRLAEALGGKWTNRERGYILSKKKADRLKQLHADGWDADVVAGAKELVPPKEREKKAMADEKASREAAGKDLSPEEIEALEKYKKAVGRKWKQRLSDDWMQARSDEVDPGTYAILHRLRNRLGPSWLVGFSLEKATMSNPRRAFEQVLTVQKKKQEASMPNPRKAFEQALVTQKLAMEFPTEEARKKYLKEHPKADPKKHTVEKGEKKPSSEKGESGFLASYGAKIVKTETKHGAKTNIVSHPQTKQTPEDIKKRLKATANYNKGKDTSNMLFNPIDVVTNSGQVGSFLVGVLDGQLYAQGDPGKYKKGEPRPIKNINFAVQPEQEKEASISNPRKAFEQALVTQKLAMEFPTEDALKKYLEEHPDADRSKHTVKKEEAKEEKKEEKKDKYEQLTRDEKHDVARSSLQDVQDFFDGHLTKDLEIPAADPPAATDSEGRQEWDKEWRKRINNFSKHLRKDKRTTDSVKIVDSMIKKLEGHHETRKELGLDPAPYLPRSGGPERPEIIDMAEEVNSGTQLKFLRDLKKDLQEFGTKKEATVRKAFEQVLANQKTLEQDFYLTAEEVADICLPCAKRMVDLGVPKIAASVLFGENFKFAREAAEWRDMPTGWTDESRKKFWESIGGSVTKCMEKIEGHVTDPGAFCASLRDRIEGLAWRSHKR